LIAQTTASRSLGEGERGGLLPGGINRNEMEILQEAAMESFRRRPNPNELSRKSLFNREILLEGWFLTGR